MIAALGGCGRDAFVARKNARAFHGAAVKAAAASAGRAEVACLHWLLVATEGATIDTVA